MVTITTKLIVTNLSKKKTSNINDKYPFSLLRHTKQVIFIRYKTLKWLIIFIQTCLEKLPVWYWIWTTRNFMSTNIQWFVSPFLRLMILSFSSQYCTWNLIFFVVSSFTTQIFGNVLLDCIMMMITRFDLSIIRHNNSNKKEEESK